MKLSLASAIAPLVLAFASVSAQSARLSASPQRVSAETLHVASKAADHPGASQRDTTSNDSVLIVAKAVPVRLVGFEARRRMGIGRFITDSVLHIDGSRQLTTVLRAYLPGWSRMLDTRPSDASPSNRCGVDVYLNGLPTLENLADLRARDVDGVEFYTTSIVPPQFRRAGTFCPVLLLWSVR
jgi:hypothetical protein